MSDLGVLALFFLIACSVYAGKLHERSLNTDAAVAASKARHPAYRKDIP